MKASEAAAMAKQMFDETARVYRPAPGVCHVVHEDKIVGRGATWLEALQDAFCRELGVSSPEEAIRLAVHERATESMEAKKRARMLRVFLGAGSVLAAAGVAAVALL